jgi:hypothetical protein
MPDRPPDGNGRPPRRSGRRSRAIAGWREWVALPDLEVPFIKAKLDTGARTSALHAFAVRQYQRDGVAMVEFDIHPVQRDSTFSIHASAPLLEERRVRSSNGKVERRPVIMTRVSLLGREWPIELTLTRRDLMGFRLLLGRQALRRRLMVDPGASFLAGSTVAQPAREGDAT